MGLFETVWIDAWPAEGGVRLVVDVRETPHRYLELGGGSDEQDQVGSFVRLRDRNLLGRGERFDLELVAGVSERGVRTALTTAGTWSRPVGFDLRGQWLTQEPVFFAAGEDVGRARFIRTVGGAGVHLGVRTDVLVQAGLMAGRVEVQPRAGVPIPSGTDACRMLTGAVAWDRLDERDVPESGFSLVGRAERSLTGLGADRDYWRAWGTAHAAVGLGGPFVLEAAAFGGLSGRDVPVYDLFRIGGPRFVPGRPRAELWERQALAAWIAPSIDLRGFRASVYGGAGNAWGSRHSISLSDLRHGIGLGIARTSRLGLIALDAGIDDDGHTAFYFSVGRRD
jgi:outer membrane protein assembly factor BamA